MNFFGIFFTFFVIPMTIISAAAGAACVDKAKGDELK